MIETTITRRPPPSRPCHPENTKLRTGTITIRWGWTACKIAHIICKATLTTRHQRAAMPTSLQDGIRIPPEKMNHLHKGLRLRKMLWMAASSRRAPSIFHRIQTILTAPNSSIHTNLAQSSTRRAILWITVEVNQITTKTINMEVIRERQTLAQPPAHRPLLA